MLRYSIGLPLIGAVILFLLGQWLLALLVMCAGAVALIIQVRTALRSSAVLRDIVVIFETRQRWISTMELLYLIGFIRFHRALELNQPRALRMESRALAIAHFAPSIGLLHTVLHGLVDSGWIERRMSSDLSAEVRKLRRGRDKAEYFMSAEAVARIKQTYPAMTVVIEGE